MSRPRRKEGYLPTIRNRFRFALRPSLATATAGLLLYVSAPAPARGYSVQTHEQLIDLTWTRTIQALLLKRYPGLSQAELEQAHAYAYGGSAIQDLGYYPFGNEFFSDLTHYVRTGDFVRALLRDARTANELAFAVGALSHYVGDSIGHAEATNPGVAEEFPKLRARYGERVTYADNPHAHVRAEFAFDINEIAKHRFAPSAYLRHVGLKLARNLLDQAFYETYGLDANQILGARRPTIRGYRFSVRTFLPRIAYAETVLHRSAFPADVKDEDFLELEQDLAQADFQNGWDRYRKKAGVGTYTLAGLIWITPKLGTLSMLAIRGPEVQAESHYVASLNHAVASLREQLEDLESATRHLPNCDLDTGNIVVPGDYRLTDRTYAELLSKITHDPSAVVPAGLERDLLAYYADPAAPISTRKDRAAWARVQRGLSILRGMATRLEPV